ncbi:unnamed protein product [Parascedosporium putredinis]|uniref:NAD(P)-binding domain-containing protein n=1 Tax=Parascedosporium putredinis TaxID=1442378 RepID=A0A9P1MAE8_9PEZI|nr:unnamed protein product [Parascedosporium putredinis]CAI7993988.1 unnamed protein product [Parascedosporium putredinis]
MPRNVCVTAADGQTGHLIAELLLTQPFSDKVDSVTALALDPESPRAKALAHLGATVESKCDTLCLVPPAHEDKFDIARELIVAAKEADVQNTLLISAAGCEYADPAKQPRLREFIDLECLFMESKGDMDTAVGHSPCIIRYALLCPKLCDGDELATAASQTLGIDLKYDEISPSEAKKVLKAQSESDASEQEYLLEYYTLVREGKTNYISTNAFHDVTGAHPTEPEEFFKIYKNEFKPAKRAKHNHH